MYIEFRKEKEEYKSKEKKINALINIKPHLNEIVTKGRFHKAIDKLLASRNDGKRTKNPRVRK